VVEATSSYTQLVLHKHIFTLKECSARLQVCSRSHRNRLARKESKSAPAEAVGLCLLEAMRMPKCQFRQQTRKARKKSGIPVPVPESQAMAE
jgi:hypothetical protein